MGTSVPPSPALQVSLSEVAGRRVYLLGGLTAPLYLTGAVIADGPLRWVMLVLGLLMAVSPLVSRGRSVTHQDPVSFTLAAGLIVLWAWLIPEAPQLAATVLCASTAFNALMVPRPWAEIGLLLFPLLYAGTPWVHGSSEAAQTQAVGVALANILVGGLLLSIRITTERRTAEHAAALAAANGRLEELNRIDPLTGLANRRSLDEALASAWARPDGSPVGFLMIDIDHFKRYNDHYGHQRGDDCLRIIAATLSASVRGTSLVARYGGEEFSVVVPGAGRDEVRALAERIRSVVAALEAEHATAPAGFLSVSIGAASAVPGDNDPGDLVHSADQALYEAKRRGRNCVAA
jgi:diguanylate cyclase (GGDEF)-like protein